MLVAQLRPRAALWAWGVSVALFGLVGAYAPNNNTLRYEITPYRLPSMPGILSEAFMVTAVLLSCLATLGILNAHRRGWAPDTRILFWAGALVALLLANLTPVGSSDTASYAAYGRITAVGGDPYVMTPAQLGGGYASLVGAAWRNTPSVYGPVATWLQAGAAFVGGDQPALTIRVLMLVNVAAFLATGYLLTRTADDPVRAGLLWIANPLLIGVLVAGGHMDTVVAGLAVCAIRLVSRRARDHYDLIAGALIGLACCVKISSILLGVGLAWPLLRSGAWQRVARQTLATMIILAALYGVYGLHALGPLSAASHQVTMPSVWAVFDRFAATWPGQDAASTVISLLWPLLMLVLASVFRRGVPSDTPAVAAVPFVLAFAWILTAPWSMPWYAAYAWALAAMFRQGRLTQYLVVTTAVLALFHSGGGHGWRW
ncbi:polyprenol phosphomannose-dependent alpha 1,6 mannosyltransferase MptB [Streptomyces sp. NPDC051636]|uniref:polyprenol phosphomannose-dependent alpha 1,6 mannosyltransferase MptB n=1 Tax=Streptomyces sp. NPDC051636 TaxID=3365663 RepID=UPI0037B9500C